MAQISSPAWTGDPDGTLADQPPASTTSVEMSRLLSAVKIGPSPADTIATTPARLPHRLISSSDVAAVPFCASNPSHVRGFSDIGTGPVQRLGDLPRPRSRSDFHAYSDSMPFDDLKRLATDLKKNQRHEFITPRRLLFPHTYNLNQQPADLGPSPSLLAKHASQMSLQETTSNLSGIQSLWDNLPNAKISPKSSQKEDISSCVADDSYGTGVYEAPDASSGGVLIPQLTPPDSRGPTREGHSSKKGDSSFANNGVAQKTSSPGTSVLDGAMSGSNAFSPFNQTSTAARHNLQGWNSGILSYEALPATTSYGQLTQPHPSTIGDFTNEPAPMQESHRARAKRLADFIKSGGAEAGDSTNAATSKSATPTSRLSTPFLPGQMLPYMPHVPIAPMPFAHGPDPLVVQFNSMGRPDFNALRFHQPFVSAVHHTQPSAAGVIKITDIPYNTQRNEVVAFLGRNARLVQQPKGAPYYAIHIIMERSTGKSMDAFVELETQQEAEWAAHRLQRHEGRYARRPRLGERTVKVHLSSQEELMGELFPRAKCVEWQGQHPLIQPPPEPHMTGFRDFIHGEELHQMVKYASNPAKTRFTGRHPQRTFESMISLLNKFPWWAVDYYTVGQRNAIFKACQALITELVAFIREGKNQGAFESLTPQLLSELLHAGLSAPGFSEKQRALLLDASTGLVGVPKFVTGMAQGWPFEVLRRKEDVSEELAQYYAAIMKQTVEAMELAAPLANNPHGDFHHTAHNAFGSLNIYNLGPDFINTDVEKLTFAQAADYEWQTLHNILQYGAGSGGL